MNPGKQLAIWDFLTSAVWTAPVETAQEHLRLGKQELFLQTTLDPPLAAGTEAAFA
jgi:hypothetical protein